MAAVSSILAGAALATAVVGTVAGVKQQKDVAKAQKKDAQARAAEITALANTTAAISTDDTGPAAAAPVNTKTGSSFKLGADNASSGRRGRRRGQGAVAPFLGGLGGQSGLRVR